MTALIASFFVVFGKAWQQQNVTHGHYLMAVFTSYSLAISEAAILLVVIDKGWNAVPWIGTGGAIGVTSAMWLHQKIR